VGEATCSVGDVGRGRDVSSVPRVLSRLGMGSIARFSIIKRHKKMLNAFFCVVILLNSQLHPMQRQDYCFLPAIWQPCFSGMGFSQNHTK
jgi:hypothetical protein